MADVQGTGLSGSSSEVGVGVGDGVEGGGGVVEDVVHKARSLMRRIVGSRPVPDPSLLHSLASILEQEEVRYEQQVGLPYTTNSRSSHTVGRLVNMIREDDDFFELVSLKLLLEAGHNTRVRASAARLLLACISCWMYPHVFEDGVLANVKQWVTEDTTKDSREGVNGKLPGRSLGVSSKQSDVLDREMLRTYATGLLAVALAGGDVVEDVLNTGMVGKLMHYLRIRVLGDGSAGADGSCTVENNRSNIIAGTNRGRDETRGRVRPTLDSARIEDTRGPERTGLDKVSTDQFMVDRASDRSIETVGKRKDTDDTVIEDKESIEARIPLEAPDLGLSSYDADEDAEDWISDDKRRRRERRDGKWLGVSRGAREDDGDEPGRAEPSKRRNDIRDRGGGRGRGKGRIGDALLDSDRVQAQPSSASRASNQVDASKGRRSWQDRSMGKQESGLDAGKDSDAIKGSTLKDTDVLEADKDDDEPLPSVFVGDVDIAKIMRKAARAAEAEAKAASAHIEAVKAAGDAAAELVRAAAFEAFVGSEDGPAALAAAHAAVATVVDAAKAVNVTRELPGAKKITVEEVPELKQSACGDEDEGLCVIDKESLANLRELYCVQCLEKMGEYLEVLGPVLHERGVDVCLALLQRQSRDTTSVKDMTMLSDVLKLICALAAHRKFASLLVDRGGVQQLLKTPIVPQTLTGISLCLFAFASLQGVMERVCALPAPVVQNIVGLALQLLGCSQDPARRNAALFFGSAFVFRAILDAFDALDGLQKMLNLLRNAAHLRSGGGSSASGSASTSAVSRNDRGLAAEVLTSSGKQIAFHTCVALRQYFRAHLLVIVDSLRPSKGHRGGSRNTSSGRAIYKPADISNEAMDAVILQLQRDRKLGPAFVRSHWAQLERFMNYGGHTILLELTQAAPNERYLHEISQHALGVFQILTLMPIIRKLVVGSTLNNERTGMAVILDAASGIADPEVIQSALLVLVNLVCPPPSLCSRPVIATSAPSITSVQLSNVPMSAPVAPSGNTLVPNVERAGRLDMNIDRNGGEKLFTSSVSSVPPNLHAAPTTPASSSTTAVVGDRRISLGPGAGGSGLAAYMEQGYRYAREAVRANNGIKVLLHLLHPRQVFPPGTLDCIRALACRVLLGLARDDAIAHILTKLQVGKLLSELLRDGSQAGRYAGIGGIGGDQGRWQAELSRVALELIAIVTNAGRASTVAASEAAAPTLRRIERAAIAAATPISYHSRELLQLIHEHLVTSGLHNSAAVLLTEAQIAPLPTIYPTTTVSHTSCPVRNSSEDHQWPSGRVSGGFLVPSTKFSREDEETSNYQFSCISSRKKSSAFSSTLTAAAKTPVAAPAVTKKSASVKESRHLAVRATESQESPNGSPSWRNITNEIADSSFKSPVNLRAILPLKRKATDKDVLPSSPVKRVAQFESGFSAPVFTTPTSRLKSNLMIESSLPSSSGALSLAVADTPVKFSTVLSQISEKVDIQQYDIHNINGDIQLSPYPSYYHRIVTPQAQTSVLPTEARPGTSEHTSLDSLVVQYLKHQHRQCPAPITTLPPLSLLHPHVCPEPSRTMDAPLNTTVRLASREMRAPFGGVHGRRHDRHFVYSRFRPWRTCRDEAVILTACTFLGHAACLAAGSHAGDIRLFDSSSGNILEMHMCHSSSITLLQSAPRDLGFSGEGPASHTGQLLLSSATYDVKLWDSSTMVNGALHSFDGCRAARFNHSGSMFGAVAFESSLREVLLYDIGTCKLDKRLSDSSAIVTGPPRGHTQAVVHFSPDDVLLLWSGALWDHRIPRSIHRFDQFTDYGGGGFHPAGNEIIINSEVWDMRSFKLLRSVPSLDQTNITFNATGDVIYATLRRNSDDIMAALNPRRVRHPLCMAFRTVDAVDYSDIATTPVDRCVLDLATEPTDSFIAVVAMDGNEEMDSYARLYEVGRRRPTDDDSDPDDGGETEEEDSEGDEDDDADEIHGDGDETDIDLASNDDEGSGDDEDLDDDGGSDFADSSEDDHSDGLGGSILELISEGEDGPTRRTFSSSDDGSAGDFGDEAFDEMLQGLL